MTRDIPAAGIGLFFDGTGLRTPRRWVTMGRHLIESVMLAQDAGDRQARDRSDPPCCRRFLCPRRSRRQSTGPYEFEHAVDKHGMPHVYAGSLPAALAGLGFLHARDRRTQVLFARAIADGRAAELIADRDEMLETDRLLRRSGLAGGLEGEVDLLSAAHRELFDAYCAGVNQGLTQFGQVVGDAVDRVQDRTVGRAECVAGRSTVGVWWPVDRSTGKRTSRDRSDSEHSRSIAGWRRCCRVGSAERILPPSGHSRFPIACRNGFRMCCNRFRNGRLAMRFAVAGTRTDSGAPDLGRAILIWRLIACRRSGTNAVCICRSVYILGATLPGCPLFAVARTPELAWSVTYMKGDTIDHFLEDVRQDDAGTWQVRRDDTSTGHAVPTWVPLTVREEIIQRKSHPSHVERIYESDTGTIVGDPDRDGPGIHLTVNWTGRLPGATRAITVWLDLLTADTVDAGRDAVRTCPQPSLVWGVRRPRGCDWLAGVAGGFRCGRTGSRG